MRTEYRFACALRNGLHARPASMLAEAVQPFGAAVTLTTQSGGAGADLRSVLSLVGLDVKHGDACVVVAEGEDAGAAIAAVRACVDTELGRGDEAPPAIPQTSEATVSLPIGLRRLGARFIGGRAACAGIGTGAAVIVEGLALSPQARDARPASAEAERRAAQHAVGAVRHELERRAAGAGVGMEGDLLRAHAQIAGDPAMWSDVQDRIRDGATAAQAVFAAAGAFADRLRGAESAYIRDRAVDVQDVGMQVLDRLTGGRSTRVHLEGDSIVCAEALTANQLLQMDRRALKGLVLGHVGSTSHTVILARSLRIPTLIDVAGAGRVARAGDSLIIDGGGGFVLTSVTPQTARYYHREQRTQERRRARLAPLAARPATTLDGVRLEVGANASTAEEVTAAVTNGAEGVGLLRTELLFLNRVEAPSEQEQFEAYAAVVGAAAGRPVIIRTFDIGGDKPAAYLPMAREENPFLGVRGLRLYERHPELLRAQLRAIGRASAGGPVKVMAPMVATAAEVRWFVERVREAQNELKAAGVAFDAAMPVGVMIEIPAAAMAMDELAREADFFSIGTNDLCQYWMAVDRGNPGVARLYNPRQPSFLRVLRTIVQGARAHKKWIGVCGEMAGDRRHLPLMIALGVDEISVAPGELLGLKSLIAEASASLCRGLLEAVLDGRDVEGVEQALSSWAWRDSAVVRGRFLDADMVRIDSDAATKEEAIKEAVDLLFIAGRTERPRDVEEAVWAREATYSTGLGFGFAVPHCKSDALAGPAMVVQRLRTPVEWGSMDGKPVQVVILLAIPAREAADLHLKVFAKLARRLMHEEFREGLRAAQTPEEIQGLLRRELEIE